MSKLNRQYVAILSDICSAVGLDFTLASRQRDNGALIHLIKKHVGELTEADFDPDQDFSAANYKGISKKTVLALIKLDIPIPSSWYERLKQKTKHKKLYHFPEFKSSGYYEQIMRFPILVWERKGKPAEINQEDLLEESLSIARRHPYKMRVSKLKMYGIVRIFCVLLHSLDNKIVCSCGKPVRTVSKIIARTQAKDNDDD